MAVSLIYESLVLDSVNLLQYNVNNRILKGALSKCYFR